VVLCSTANVNDVLNAWILSNAGSSVSDACSSVSWTNDYDGLGIPSVPCVNDTTNRLTVIFTAEDECSNTIVQTAEFIVIDTVAPQIVEPVRDSVVYCGVPDIDAVVDGWIANNAGSIVSGACSNINWTNDYNGLGVPTVACDNDTTNRLIVTFTASDGCSNAISQTARFIVVDTLSPQLVEPVRC